MGPTPRVGQQIERFQQELRAHGCEFDSAPTDEVSGGLGERLRCAYWWGGYTVYSRDGVIVMVIPHTQ